MPNIHETKTHLSKLVSRVEMGEEITISRASKARGEAGPLSRSAGESPRDLEREDPDRPDFDAHDQEIAGLFRAE